MGAVRRAVRADDLFAGLPAGRAALLRAALDLFVERGFEATSVPAVARRAGMATGSVYLHVKSKEQLVNVLLAHLRGRVAGRLVERVDLAASVREQFDAIWDVFAAQLVGHPEAVAFCDLHHHAAYLTPETLDAWEPARRVLDAHVAAGRRQGLYRELPPGALRALMAGAILGISKLARMGEVNATPRLLEQVREAVWAGLRRPKPARRAAKERR
jgi:AcrR family transcriptional regulator